MRNHEDDDTELLAGAYLAVMLVAVGVLLGYLLAGGSCDVWVY